MCHSSRLTLFFAGLALLPTAAAAQFYGFPSEVGVVDDGYGVLPPARPTFTPGSPDALPPPFGALPPSPPPCPLVIQVGKGVRQVAKTRVIYGHATPCS